MAINYTALASELTTDPLSRGYSSMSDQVAANSLNTANRTVDRLFITSEELAGSIDLADWSGLTNEQRIYMTMLTGSGAPIRTVAGSQTRTNLLALFGAGTTTRANLLPLLTHTISRAAELGFDPIGAGDVAKARA